MIAPTGTPPKAAAVPIKQIVLFRIATLYFAMTCEPQTQKWLVNGKGSAEGSIDDISADAEMAS
jgi:hypothetical protein